MRRVVLIEIKITMTVHPLYLIGLLNLGLGVQLMHKKLAHN
jgi:hypothetical protein